LKPLNTAFQQLQKNGLGDTALGLLWIENRVKGWQL
jgi:hypothetical protein